jgi:23S rRNA (adenine2503-C2)-methyltransferase
MSSHELPPIELKLATDAPSVAIGVPVSAKQNLMDLDREGLEQFFVGKLG